VDVLICSPYKFFGPHLGLFYGRRELLEGWRPYKVRPSAEEPVARRFETGTLAHEALAGFSAAVAYVESIGWDAIQAHERELGQRFLDGLPPRYRLFGLPTMAERTPTFALTHPRRSPHELAAGLAERDIAAWPGNYYAVEVMERLGLAEGMLRVGLVHYNTADEVDRALAALEELA
jgi:selenocysteine lyase/cysteine desulfurase